MKLKKPICSVICLIYIVCGAIAGAQSIVPGSSVVVQSPDKNMVISFYQKGKENNKRTMYYSVSFKGKPVVLESVMDLKLDNHLSESAMALKVDEHEDWCENLTITGIKTSATDTTWKPVYGEKSTIRDHYNSATIAMVKDDNSIYKMNVEIRAYDEGIAFRYYFPENEKGTYYRIINENTTFSFAEGTKAWVAYWAQAPYQKLPLNNWKWESERPLTLELSNGLFACLTEAQMVDYARTKFKLSAAQPNTLLTSMYTPADLISPFATPWRVIMVAEKPGTLIENDNLILNLNKPIVAAAACSGYIFTWKTVNYLGFIPATGYLIPKFQFRFVLGKGRLIIPVQGLQPAIINCCQGQLMRMGCFDAFVKIANGIIGGPGNVAGKG